MNLGQTDKPAPKREIDWNAILFNITSFGRQYLTERQRQNQGSGSQGGGGGGGRGDTPPKKFTLNRAVLIGGGVVAAGLLVYFLTRKK